MKKKIALLGWFVMVSCLQGCLIGAPQTIPAPDNSSVEVDASDTGEKTGQVRIVWDSMSYCLEDEEEWQVKIRRKKAGKWVLSRQEKVNCSKGEWIVLSLAPGEVQVELRRSSDLVGRPISTQTVFVQAGKESRIRLTS